MTKYHVCDLRQTMEKQHVRDAADRRIGQCPQVVPQLVAAQEEQPDFPPAKADIIFRVFLDLQAGQAGLSFSSLVLNRTSNSFWHFLHRNS
jgi:hypothetical protein